MRGKSTEPGPQADPVSPASPSTVENDGRRLPIGYRYYLVLAIALWLILTAQGASWETWLIDVVLAMLLGGMLLAERRREKWGRIVNVIIGVISFFAGVGWGELLVLGGCMSLLGRIVFALFLGLADAFDTAVLPVKVRYRLRPFLRPVCFCFGMLWYGFPQASTIPFLAQGEGVYGMITCILNLCVVVVWFFWAVVKAITMIGELHIVEVVVIPVDCLIYYRLVSDRPKPSPASEPLLLDNEAPDHEPAYERKLEEIQDRQPPHEQKMEEAQDRQPVDEATMEGSQDRQAADEQKVEQAGEPQSPSARFQVGDVVLIHGLEKFPHLNDKRAIVASEFDGARFEVLVLDSDQKVRVRPQSLLPI